MAATTTAEAEAIIHSVFPQKILVQWMLDDTDLDLRWVPTPVKTKSIQGEKTLKKLAPGTVIEVKWGGQVEAAMVLGPCDKEL